MKRQLDLIIGLLGALAISAVAQTQPHQTKVEIQDPHWLTAGEIHAIVQQEPPPPDPGSAADQADLKSELDAQKARTPECIAESRMDAGYSMALFSKVIGFPITRDTKPVTTLFFQRLNKEMGDVLNESKGKWRRLRPFVAHPEIQSLFPMGGYSYPSGHSCTSFADAVILGQLFPDKARALLDRAQKIAQSRVDAGVHYESDIKEGEVVGREFARELLTKPAFLDELNTAKAEWKSAP